MSEKEIKDLQEQRNLGFKIATKRFEKIIDLFEENNELQERINKAIEYIEHYGNLYCLRHKQFKEYKQYEDLLDILKGDNNE